jgi:hypothetical protein
MSRGWLGVVSAEHVRRGVHLGIAQINHSKRAPLARMNTGDTLIYYSPTTVRGEPDGLQSFTAIGTFPDDTIWQADEGEFRPFRRRIDYEPAAAVTLDELRPRLELTSDANWGYRLRLGLIELAADDVALIREAMRA